MPPAALVTARTSRANAAEAQKTARISRWLGKPAAAKPAEMNAATAGPTTTPDCDEAETRERATPVWAPLTRSVTAA